MNGFDEVTRALVESTVRSAVASMTNGPEVLASLNQLGWNELVDEAPADAARILFTQLGRAGRATRALDTVLLGELGRAGDDAVIGGDCVIAYPLPPDEEYVPVTSSRPVRALLLAPPVLGQRLLVPLRTADVCGLAAVEVDEVSARPLEGWLPDAGWHEIEFAQPLAECVRVNPSWPNALAAARRAIAHELIGACTGMLEIATRFATERQQFGRPIGSYQAVRHKLAEARVWTSSAAALVSVSEREPANEIAAMSAKAHAGRAHAEVSSRALQTCGAMGMTWEFGLHRFVRRGFQLDALLGSGERLTAGLGEAVIERGPGDPSFLTPAAALLS